MTTVTKAITIQPHRVLVVDRKMGSDHWQMTMGDDDQYGSGPGQSANVLECVAFGHFGQEEADHGVMWYRLSSTAALEIHFNVMEG